MQMRRVLKIHQREEKMRPVEARSAQHQHQLAAIITIKKNACMRLIRADRAERQTNVMRSTSTTMKDRVAAVLARHKWLGTCCCICSLVFPHPACVPEKKLFFFLARWQHHFCLRACVN